ncbi:MAG: hypothetical protein ACK5JT_12080 [Hyphomicrobiaceae bacterium]
MSEVAGVRGTLMAAAVAGGLAGCSPQSLQLPKIEPASKPEGAEGVVQMSSEEDATEVYSRVARGALKCWFGSEGSLKADYTFHAKAEPMSDGGAAQISIQTRSAENRNWGALTAFRAVIKTRQNGSGTSVETENLRFSKEQGVAMTGDIRRWLTGVQDCSVMGSGGWGAKEAASAAERAGPTSSKKAKSK